MGSMGTGGGEIAMFLVAKETAKRLSSWKGCKKMVEEGKG